jgi:hypothetical protein
MRGHNQESCARGRSRKSGPLRSPWKATTACVSRRTSGVSLRTRTKVIAALVAPRLAARHLPTARRSKRLAVHTRDPEEKLINAGSWRGLSTVSQMVRRPDGRWHRRHSVAHALEPVVA